MTRQPRLSSFVWEVTKDRGTLGESIHNDKMKFSTNSVFFMGVVLLCTLCLVSSEQEEAKEEEVKVDEDKLTWARGSVCGYCEYCKFCKLCDEDCPCETSASKPNCKMCKYCKYCYLCKAVCSTVCQPGGIIDKVSAALVNALPTADTDEIDKDIDSVKDYVKRDEL